MSRPTAALGHGRATTPAPAQRRRAKASNRPPAGACQAQASHTAAPARPPNTEHSGPAAGQPIGLPAVVTKREPVRIALVAGDDLGVVQRLLANRRPRRQLRPSPSWPAASASSMVASSASGRPNVRGPAMVHAALDGQIAEPGRFQLAHRGRREIVPFAAAKTSSSRALRRATRTKRHKPAAVGRPRGLLAAPATTRLSSREPAGSRKGHCTGVVASTSKIAAPRVVPRRPARQRGSRPGGPARPRHRFAELQHGLPRLADHLIDRGMVAGRRTGQLDPCRPCVSQVIGWSCALLRQHQQSLDGSQLPRDDLGHAQPLGRPEFQRPGNRQSIVSGQRRAGSDEQARRRWPGPSITRTVARISLVPAMPGRRRVDGDLVDHALAELPGAIDHCLPTAVFPDHASDLLARPWGRLA